MKNTLLLLFITAFCCRVAAQDTFSIVALDSTTREIGSAGASCLDLFQTGFTDPSFLGDLFPDTGAINTQAYYIAGNQVNARLRMRAGDTPLQIISWLVSNDVQSNPTQRQYGIVGFNGNMPEPAAYTGSNCIDYKNHATGNIDGIYYSIQGNILEGQNVIDSMEARFRREPGDIACRMMAALQGANVVGADHRCVSNSTSSLFAFVKVAQPGDTYGNPSFKLTVKTHDGDKIEPVDSLQILFDAVHNCESAGKIDVTRDQLLNVYPDADHSHLHVEFEAVTDNTIVALYTIQGQLIMQQPMKDHHIMLDVSNVARGMYVLSVDNQSFKSSQKIVIE